jgi:SAM-dependent methyltransferase
MTQALLFLHTFYRGEKGARVRLNLTIRILLIFGLVFFGLQLLIRILCYFKKFPFPGFLLGCIDNPLRRQIQKPERLVAALGINPGSRLLEIGPGSGSYTQAFARAVGQDGSVIAIDIDLSVLNKLQATLSVSKLYNVFPLVADVHQPPFASHVFERIYMITVIGEIPDASVAVRSFHDLSAPGGRLMFSELLFDPDFTLPRTLRSWAQAADLRELQLDGGLLSYSITFARSE